MAVVTVGPMELGAPSACRLTSYRPETGTNPASLVTFIWAAARGAAQSLTVSPMVRSELLVSTL